MNIYATIRTEESTTLLDFRVCVCQSLGDIYRELNSPAHSCQTCWGREEGTKRTMRDSIHESPTHIYSAAAWSTADMNDDSGGGDSVRWRNMLTLLCLCVHA